MPEARIVWRGKQLNKRTVAIVEFAAWLRTPAHPKVGELMKRYGYTIVA